MLPVLVLFMAMMSSLSASGGTQEQPLKIVLKSVYV